MTFREAALFVYGLIFATSTPYLKPKKRYLFPTTLRAFDSKLTFLLGGSGICASLGSETEYLVVNTNQGEAADAWRNHVAHEAGGRSVSVALSALTGSFGDAKTLGDLSGLRVVYAHADEGADLDRWLSFPLQAVTEETVLSIGGETVRLLPVFDCATGSDLVVFFETRSVMMFGALFNNRIHPQLKAGVAARAEAWIATLERLLAVYQPRICVPGEGELGTADDVREFVRYLRALKDPGVEFSYCRQNFDWIEIPSTTSLEENFDLLRRNVKTHTSLN